MIKRHQEALESCLDEIFNEGYLIVPRWKILMWYGYDRFVATIRKDIQDRWSSYANVGDEALLIGEFSGGRTILIARKENWWAEDATETEILP